MDPMFEKDDKYYADWRNKAGQRLRKSFTSKRAALQREAEQKELAHPKQRATGKLSLISCSPRQKRGPVSPSLLQLAKPSSPQPVQPTPQISPSGKSPKQRPSSAKTTHRQRKAAPAH